jgi:hypothetical protein
MMNLVAVLVLGYFTLAAAGTFAFKSKVSGDTAAGH